MILLSCFDVYKSILKQSKKDHKHYKDLKSMHQWSFVVVEIRPVRLGVIVGDLKAYLRQ